MEDILWMIPSLLSILIWPAIIFGVIYIIIRKRRKKKGVDDKNWYLQFAFSREDSTSQLMIFLSVLFLGITLLAINRDLGDLVSWKIIILITSLAAIAIAYWLRVLYALIIGLIGIYGWLGIQTAFWVSDDKIKATAIISGLAFLSLLYFSIGEIHSRYERAKRYSIVYSVLGILLINGLLFFFSTKIGITALEEATRGDSPFSIVSFSVIIFVLVVAIIGSNVYTYVNNSSKWREILAVAILFILFSIILLLSKQNFVLDSSIFSYMSQKETLTPAGLLWAVILNAVAFLELVGIIFLGYLRRQTWLINMGAFFLFIFILIKYFDWFFSFLDKSLFFIGAGILLLALGWFMERGRKKMLLRISEQNQVINFNQNDQAT